MATYKKTMVSGKMSLLTKGEATRTTKYLKKFAKDVKLTTKKDKDFGKLYVINYKTSKFVKKK